MIEDIILEKLKASVEDVPPAVGPAVPAPGVGVPAAPSPSASASGDPQLWLSELTANIQKMELTRQNYAFRPLYSCRKLIGGLIVFFKRVVRKLLKWYVEPICFQQTEFNNAVTPSIGRLTELSHYLLENVEQTQRTVGQQTDELRRRVDAMDAQIGQAAALAQRMDAQIDQAAALTQRVDVQADQAAALTQRVDAQAAQAAVLAQRMDAQADQAAALIQRVDAQADQAAALIQRVEAQADQAAARTRELEARIEELKNMLTLSAERMRTLESDMDRVRAVDASIFKPEGQSFFKKNTSSQSGEDSIIAYIFMMLGHQAQDVTYLDLGANHAREMSNTYYFYQQGARGVLVEANPDLIPELKLYRSGDIILNRCVSDTDGETVEFYLMNGDGLSSQKKESVERAAAIHPLLEITRTVQVETISPNYILEHYFSDPPRLLNIDIEGSDLAVLSAWNFEKYRPLVIVAETIPYETSLVIGEKEEEIVKFLTEKGYVEYAFTGINSIFIDKSQLKRGDQG